MWFILFFWQFLKAVLGLGEVRSLFLIVAAKVRGIFVILDDSGNLLRHFCEGLFKTTGKGMGVFLLLQ